MRKMAHSNILISGMKGLGVEIAKNVVLGGVKSVCIHDTENAAWNDLSSQVNVLSLCQGVVSISISSMQVQVNSSLIDQL